MFANRGKLENFALLAPGPSFIKQKRNLRHFLALNY